MSRKRKEVEFEENTRAPAVIDLSEEGRAYNLKQFVNQIVVIEDAKVINTRRGEMARMIICIPNEKGECKEDIEVYTFSRVVADQVKNKVIPLIEKGNYVRVKILQHQKGYLYLAPPR